MTKKILIVDDEASVADFLAKALAGKAVVLKAYNAQQGLELSERETPDIVFLDLNMPRVDGIELLRRIRAKSRYQTVIAMSGGADAEKARKVMLMGVFDFVTKPFDIKYVHTLVDARLAVTEP